MKKRIIMVHGWGGSPEGDWFPWVAQAFKDRGYEVIVPEMPDTEHPVIEKWVGHLKSVVPALDENTYFIGHSIGCQAVMRFLETASGKARAAILVAGWFDVTNLDESEEDEIRRPWAETPIDDEKVKAAVSDSIVILSDNDPYVPYEQTKRDFETRFESEVITIPGAGHMTTDDGWTTFPQLLEIFESHFGR